MSIFNRLSECTYITYKIKNKRNKIIKKNMEKFKIQILKCWYYQCRIKIEVGKKLKIIFLDYLQLKNEKENQRLKFKN